MQVVPSAPAAAVGSIRARRALRRCGRALNLGVRPLVSRYPTSATRLKIGDCTFVPREDGRLAIFVVLYLEPRKRSYFYGGYLRATAARPEIALLSYPLFVECFAMVGTDFYANNHLVVAGNIASAIAPEELERVAHVIECTPVGRLSFVWGWAAAMKQANKVVAA
jgi:hypothetical protein